MTPLFPYLNNLSAILYLQIHMLSSPKVNRLAITVIAGFCLALPFIFTPLWWLVILGLALTIHSIVKSRSYKEALLIGWFLGTAKSLGGFYFIWATFPLTGISIGSPILEWLSVCLYWLSSALFMGGGGVLLGVCLYWLSKNKPLLISIIFPLLLVTTEVVGSFLVSIVFLGPGVFLNIYLANGYSGILMSHLSAFYPFVRLTGVYGLSFLTGTFGVLLYNLMFGDYKTRRNTAMILLGFVVVIYFLYLSYSPIPYTKTGERYLAIDTDFPTRAVIKEQGLDIDKSKELIEAVTTAYKYNPDVILLPEDARLINAFGSEEKTLAFLQTISEDVRPLVVDSARTEVANNTHSYLRAFYYDTEGVQIYKKDKQYLISGGEYISYLFNGVMLLLGQEELVKVTSKDLNYIPGPMKGYEDFPEDFPAIIFCFESSSAFAANQNNQLGNVVLHPLSHSNFHTPELLWYQLDALLRTQAIWSGKVIISATNMAQSKIYYPDGRIETGKVLDKKPLWQLISYDI